MKTILITISLFFAISAQAYEGVQYSLGVTHFQFDFQGGKTSWDVPSATIEWKSGEDHIIKVDKKKVIKNYYTWDGGFSLGLGGANNQNQTMIFGSGIGELGGRAYLNEELSFAAHAVISGVYMFYENRSYGLNQLNGIEGFLVGLGGNIEAKYQVNENYSFGIKYEQLYFNNLGGDAKINTSTPSLFLVIKY